jgi:hypothetical protein
MRSEHRAEPSGAVKASSSPIRLLPSAGVGARPLRVAMLAPPWIPIPPPGYGGIEAVVGLLCEGLVARGHDLTLFATPGCRASAAERYDVTVSAAGYERVYREAIDARRRHGSLLPPRAVLERRRAQAQPARTSS